MKEKRVVIRLSKKDIARIAVAAIILTLAFQNYRTCDLMIRYQRVPILSRNWWQALNWIRNNTPSCAVVATYWDPGHFITEIARRPVVFDGASQNAKLTWEERGILSEDEIREIVAHDKFTYAYDYERNVTTITTARIQDIAITLFTDNETQAVKILKRYLMPNCNNSMYYIASADLIGKSQWWSYFATWSKSNYTGTKYFYYPLRLSGRTKSGNATVHVFIAGRDSAFFVYDYGNDMELLYQKGASIGRVEDFFYFLNATGYEKTYTENVTNNGLFWLSPTKDYAIYVPKELKNSLFTRLFFFHGTGLKHFEFIGNWGGEVKLFKVKFG